MLLFFIVISAISVQSQAQHRLPPYAHLFNADEVNDLDPNEDIFGDTQPVGASDENEKLVFYDKEVPPESDTFFPPDLQELLQDTDGETEAPEEEEEFVRLPKKLVDKFLSQASGATLGREFLPNLPQSLLSNDADIEDLLDDEYEVPKPGPIVPPTPKPRPPIVVEEPETTPVRPQPCKEVCTLQCFDDIEPVEAVIPVQTPGGELQCRQECTRVLPRQVYYATSVPYVRSTPGTHYVRGYSRYEPASTRVYYRTASSSSGAKSKGLWGDSKRQRRSLSFKSKDSTKSSGTRMSCTNVCRRLPAKVKYVVQKTFKPTKKCDEVCTQQCPRDKAKSTGKSRRKRSSIR